MPVVVPVAEIAVGEWIARVDGEIVARGSTAEEVTERAWQEGHEDFVVERISEPGTYLL